ncbi:MAG: hypothetical protein ACI4SQ_06350 [Eubacterium sp.]
MVGILVKKQMTEIFRGYFYDAKKNKKRSKISTILFILMYIVIMVGILGGMFSFLAVKLCEPFAQIQMSWLYFLIMGMIAIALGAFGSVFNTFSGLYLSKDNDLLLSMPIPNRAILVARLLGVYLMGVMYSAVVIVPASIVYWVVLDVTPDGVAGPILFMLLISIIVLILSCALGWCVAKISIKLKNKSFMTVVLSLVFFALYYLVYFKAQVLIQNLLKNALVYGNKVKGSAYPLYLFGRIGEGDVLAMVIFTVAILALAALTFRLLDTSFIRIATATGSTEKVVYHEKREKKKSEFGALLTKEFGRFTSSPNYILNCGLGTIFLPILGVFALIKGESILQSLSAFVGGEDARGIVIVVVVAAICVVATMNDMVVPSVSLEGKNLWIVQSLPIKPWNVLRAKLGVQLLVTVIPVIVCEICVAVCVNANAIQWVFIMITPIVFTVMMTVVGLFLGINMPNLTWTNELAPIKQSLSVMISMFGGWAIAIGIALIYFVGGKHMGYAWYLLLVTVVCAIVSIVIYSWLKRKGTEKFMAL